MGQGLDAVTVMGEQRVALVVVEAPAVGSLPGGSALEVRKRLPVALALETAKG